MRLESIDVLLVEDNPLHTRLLQGLLAQAHQNCNVAVTRTLKEGILHAEENSFDVVLLDLVLPDARGLESFQRWKREAPQGPVIILTGLDDMGIATRAVENGADDYLLKNQITPALLNRSLRYAVDRWRVHRREWDAPTYRRLQEQVVRAADAIALNEEIMEALLLPQNAEFSARAHRDQEGTLHRICSYEVRHLQGERLSTLELGLPQNLGAITAQAISLSLRCALQNVSCVGAATAIWSEGSNAPREMLEDRALELQVRENQLLPNQEERQRANAFAQEILLKDLPSLLPRGGRFSGVRSAEKEEILWLKVPGELFTAEWAARTKARVIVEAVDYTIVPEADEILFDRGILVLPDLLSSSWYLNGPPPGQEKSEEISRRVQRTFLALLEMAQYLGTDLRTAALAKALEVLSLPLRRSSNSQIFTREL